MRKLDGYIGSSVILATLVVLIIISGLSLLFIFIDQLEDLEGGYGLREALIYVGLSAPGRMYEVLPMSALIGCLVGLGTLASNSELTVMRAAGVPLIRIVWSVMKPLLVLMLAGLLVAEYVAPRTDSMAQEYRASAQALGEAPKIARHGVWHRQGQEFIHINSVQSDGALLGVTRYFFDEQRVLHAVSFSRSATHDGQHWLLQDVAYTYLDTEGTKVTQKADELWKVPLTPELLTTVVTEPDALSISRLWSYTRYLAAQGLSTSNYMVSFWGKVLQPLVTAMLVLMAISFIFGPLRSVTLGQRMFTGVVVGFVFKIAQDMLGPASVLYGFAPLLAVLLPVGVCAVIGLWLLRRAG